MNKSVDAFRTISEVSDELDVPKHVLRFWEARFPQIKPMKRGGGRRYYRPQDVELLKGIRHLLHAEGYTIRGVQKILREHGVDQVKQSAQGGVPPPVAAGASAATAQRKGARGRVAAKPDGAAAPAKSGDTTRVLLAAIAELEKLRRLLRNGEGAVEPEPALRRARPGR